MHEGPRDFEMYIPDEIEIINASGTELDGLLMANIRRQHEPSPFRTFRRSQPMLQLGSH
jgi:hypothetical protein